MLYCDICNYFHIQLILCNYLKVQCHSKNTAPCGMARGSATNDHNFAYFTPHNSTLRTEQWEELPSCPYRDSALVIIDGELTIYCGGRELI